MLERREFLIKSSLAAAGAMIAPRLSAEKAAEHWAPYRHSFVIDGQGGIGSNRIGCEPGTGRTVLAE